MFLFYKKIKKHEFNYYHQIACGILLVGNLIQMQRKKIATDIQDMRNNLRSSIYHKLLLESFLNKYNHLEQFTKHKKHFDDMVFYNGGNNYFIRYSPPNNDGNIIVHCMYSNEDFEIENPYLEKKYLDKSKENK